ncbi:MAG: hypothetical protein JOZ14_13710 [Acidobacteria bacterium]|nr:hypothetical protein [Acidobacteriota bacterium]
MVGPLGRLVVDNSACEGNFHLKTDIEDFHQYYSMPDHVDKWDKWLADFAARPEWTYSTYGDAQRTGREPLLVSEFGNWGLPKLPEELPWWFELGFGTHEVARPRGVLDRFRTFRFDEIFGTFNQLAEETQRHQFSSLKYEIESIRSAIDCALRSSPEFQVGRGFINFQTARPCAIVRERLLNLDACQFPELVRL